VLEWHLGIAARDGRDLPVGSGLQAPHGGRKTESSPKGKKSPRGSRNSRNRDRERERFVKNDTGQQ